MEKILFLVLVIMCARQYAYAQPYSYIKVLDNEMKIVPGQQGTFYAVKRILSCLNYQINVRFFNRKGELVSSHVSSSFYNTNVSYVNIDGMTTANNHLLLLFGNNQGDHYLYEYDTALTVLNKNKIQAPAPTFTYSKIISASTGGYYLVGKYYAPLLADSSHGVVTRLSSNLNVIWTRTYRMKGNAPSSVSFNDILLQNNKLICGGQYHFLLPQPPKMRPLMMVLDTSGNILTSKYYLVDSSSPNTFHDYEFVNVEVSPSGYYYGLANNYGNEHAVFKTDFNLNPIWIREMQAGRATAMCAGYNEDLFICPDLMVQNFILQLDSSGNDIANHVTKYSAVYDISLGQITELCKHDCGFFMANNENMYAHVPESMVNCLDSTNNNYMPYYVQTNFYAKPCELESFGYNTLTCSMPLQTFSPTAPLTVNTLCFSTYNCQSPTLLKNEHHNLVNIRVFPVPVNDRLYIELNDNIQTANIRLINLFGEVVRKMTFSGNRVVSLETGNLPEGYYMLYSSTEKGNVVNKVQVVH